MERGRIVRLLKLYCLLTIEEVKFGEVNWYAEAKAKRPLGVSILGVLNILGGIVFLGVTCGATYYVLFADISQAGGIMGGGDLFALFGAFIIALGLILVVGIVGILGLAVGWGFWKGSGWAWILGLVLYIIGVLLGVISLAGGDVTGIVTIIINVLIVYYLNRPNVKAWFGKA